MASGSSINSKKSILEAVTTDSTPFEGSDIDAKISSAGLDIAKLRTRAGLLGYKEFFIHSISNKVSVTANGGATFNVSENGLRMDAGITNGDTATLDVWNPTSTTRNLELDVLFDASPGKVVGDIGLTNSSVDSDFGAYLHLKDSTVHVDGTSKSINSNFGGFYRLNIRIDRTNNETTFRLVGKSSVDDTVVISDTPDRVASTVAQIKSEGRGRNMRVFCVRVGAEFDA